MLEYNQRTSKLGRPKLKIQLRDRELVLEAESLVFNEEVNKKMHRLCRGPKPEKSAPGPISCLGQ